MINDEVSIVECKQNCVALLESGILKEKFPPQKNQFLGTSFISVPESLYDSFMGFITENRPDCVQKAGKSKLFNSLKMFFLPQVPTQKFTEKRTVFRIFRVQRLRIYGPEGCHV